MDIPILQDIAIVFGLAIPIIATCRVIKLPTLVALFVTGIVAGPEGAGIIHSHKEVEHLAEIGVILLLFTIGIEFSLKELWKMKFLVLVGGTLQVFLTAIATMLILLFLKVPLPIAIFAGCLLAPSSTAVVLKILQENAQINNPHGRTALAVLIYQDIIVIPMMLLFPLLTGQTDNIYQTLSILLGKGILLVVVTIVGAIWVIPKLMDLIARSRSIELFLLSVVAIGLLTAIGTLKMGLSLGLGAFLAGLIISESRYSYQALAGILPFRQTFMPFFFISMGMLLDIQYVFQNIIMIIAFSAIVIVAKASIIVGVARVLRLTWNSSILTGITLAQVGEFSFVLAASGGKIGLNLGEYQQLYLAVSVVTMGLAPFLFALAPKISALLVSPEADKVGPIDDCQQQDHLIIVGYGLNGRNIAHAARAGQIPYVIIEFNPITVQEEAAKGEPIYYGNAIHNSILEHANIHQARSIVVVISDYIATRKIVSVARQLNPNLYIIARTRFVAETKTLYECGANEVIPEEFETSVEIFTRVLKKYLVAESKIQNFTRQIRENNYQILRETEKVPLKWQYLKIHLPEIEINTFEVKNSAEVCGKELQELDWSKKFHTTVLAIKRGGEIITPIYGDTKVVSEDEIIVLGKAEDLATFSQFLEKQKPQET